VGEDRIARDLEASQGVDWSRSTWSEPSEDGSLVVVRQTLSAHGDQEVVWRVPADRLGELCAALGAPGTDADGVLGWTEEEPDRLDQLVLALEGMQPPVVEDLYLS
jgi:hypothetical protein